MSFAFLDKFINYLKNEKLFSHHTVVNYQRDLQSAIDFFVKENIHHFQEIKEQHIRALLVHGKTQKKSARTLNRQLSSLRSLFQYLIREGIIQDSPTKVIRSLKTPQLLPKPIDVDQMSKLLNMPQDDLWDCRDSALMELMYSAGLRVSELSNLNLCDLNLEQCTLRIMGKGKKVRIGIIGKKAVEALKKWMVQREEIIVGQGIQIKEHNKKQSKELKKELKEALFINKYARRLSVRSIQYCLYRRGVKQGVDERVHPHRLRHSFASHLLESSGDLKAVQELLGHADLSSTQIYTRLNFQHLAKVYDEYHPRAHRCRNSSKQQKKSETLVSGLTPFDVEQDTDN